MKICCCHAMTAGAVTGILQYPSSAREWPQVVLATLMLAGSAITLHRWRTWQQLEPNQWARRPTEGPVTVTTTTATTSLGETTVAQVVVNTVAPTTYPSHWIAAWLEFELAQAVGFCSVWLVSLAVYALAFRYYLAIMVLPNLFVLIMALFVTFILAVASIMRLVAVDSDYNLDDYEEAILVYLTAWLLLFFLILFVFIILVWKFYKHMKMIGRKDRVIVEGPTFD